MRIKSKSKLKVQNILSNLPTGVTYIGPEGALTEENVMRYVKNPNSFKESSSIAKLEDKCLFGQCRPS